jgi:heme exporter protein B
VSVPFRNALLVAAKDLRGLRRRPEQILSLLVFALLLLVVFHFAFDFSAFEFATLGPGVLWAAVLFSGVLALDQSFRMEREEDRIDGLLMAPIDRSAIYGGKLIANVAVMTLVATVLAPLSAIFFNQPIDLWLLRLLPAAALNILGLAAVGTLFAAVTTQLRQGDRLLPVLLFPAAVPIALAAVRSTSAIVAGRPLDRYAHWLTLSAAYDLIFLAAAVLLFDHILQD